MTDKKARYQILWRSRRSFSRIKKNMISQNNLEISIVGGGLVGSLCACILGNQGLTVNLYESREDMRTLKHVQGRSINLALSERGRSALRLVGLEGEVIKNHGIPMQGRMIHDLQGRRRPIPYGRKGQCIYSVGRRFLNETLLTAAEKNANVKIHFNNKVLRCDLQAGKLTVQNSDGTCFTKEADLTIGCDGAYSIVRREMLKRPLFDYNQTYIPHGYLELCIPPGKDGKFAMEANHLHIWPRKTFMLIALPNQDQTYTVTLFMPFVMFEKLASKEQVLQFFVNYFSDVIPLIGEEKLVTDFLNTKASPLVTVKCHPYHVNDKVLILGDAAHAMVPFFGQGMNAGFEDCEIFAELMDLHSNKLVAVLPEFTERRNVDAQIICDLAVGNYIEMRHSVTSFTFLLRKKIDAILQFLFPKSWIPLYSMVTFTKLRYSSCQSLKKRQDKVLTSLMWCSSAAFLSAAITLILKLKYK